MTTNNGQITKIYSIFDAAAEAYMQPFFAKTNGLALRIFADTISSEKSVLHAHPGDFTLFEIGSFNEETGEITPLEAYNRLGGAIEYHSQGVEAVQ